MPSRRPFLRAGTPSPRTLAVISLGVATAALLSVLVPLHAAAYGTPVALAFLLGAGTCAPILLAISHPRWATALFCVSAIALALTASPAGAASAPWPWSVPALLCLVLVVSVTTFTHGARMGALPLLIGLAGSLLIPLVRPDAIAAAGTSDAITADLIVTASVAAPAYVIAILAAGRMRVSAELADERRYSASEQARRALVEERTRIARELHDVIAHSMSVIQVQASTARYRLPTLDEAAVAEFEGIAAAARESLVEMRRVLGVLRTEGQNPELAPQHGIGDLSALVDATRRAGVVVGLEITGTVSDLPQSVHIAAYRIVQEGLSNAARHAAGAAVTVRVQAGDDAVLVRVRNAPAVPVTPTGTGYGLRGMRERVELLGGSFHGGATSEGGWEISATLPIRVEHGEPSEETA